MKYIHEHHQWPDLHWDSEALTPLLIDIRNKQGFYLGRMSALGFDVKVEANLEMLTMNIVKSSEIEGEQLDKEQVRSSVAQRLGLDIVGLPQADRHIDGIVEMMLDATQKHQKSLTETRLFSWHNALFPTQRSGLKHIKVGAWRPEEAGPMQVVSGPMGREKVHFEAPEASRLHAEMVAFLDWFEHAKGVDLVIKAGVSHFWFVTIHPFEDGNGRIARAISDMCLALSDGVSQRFYSMSSQIEKERKDYYKMLESSQKGRLDITSWLEWFLSCLGRAILDASLLLDNVLYKTHIWSMLNQYSINTRQRKVMNRLLENFQGKLTTSKYAKLAKCSHDTALRDIRKLIEYGVLRQEAASGRSTSYALLSHQELI